MHYMFSRVLAAAVFTDKVASDSNLIHKWNKLVWWVKNMVAQHEKFE